MNELATTKIWVTVFGPKANRWKKGVWGMDVFDKPCAQTMKNTVQKVQQWRFGTCCFHDVSLNNHVLQATMCVHLRLPLFAVFFVPLNLVTAHWCARGSRTISDVCAFFPSRLSRSHNVSLLLAADAPLLLAAHVVRGWSETPHGNPNHWTDNESGLFDTKTFSLSLSQQKEFRVASETRSFKKKHDIVLQTHADNFFSCVIILQCKRLSTEDEARSFKLRAKQPKQWWWCRVQHKDRGINKQSEWARRTTWWPKSKKLQKTRQKTVSFGPLFSTTVVVVWIVCCPVQLFATEKHINGLTKAELWEHQSFCHCCTSVCGCLWMLPCSVFHHCVFQFQGCVQTTLQKIQFHQMHAFHFTANFIAHTPKEDCFVVLSKDKKCSSMWTFCTASKPMEI